MSMDSESLIKLMVSNGYSQPFAQGFVGHCSISHKNMPDNKLVEKIIGRPPTSLPQWVTHNLHLFWTPELEEPEEEN